MRQITEFKFDHRDRLFDTLLKDVMAGLSSALKDKPKASMLLSGGTSPGPLYKMMSEQTLDWGKVWFGLSDERWVDPESADSNERLVRETLLTGEAAAANFIGLKSSDPDILKGAVLSNCFLKALPRPFDIVLLGMGLDGHTASLFPDSPDTPAALKGESELLCYPIRRGANEIPRLTMTGKALLGSQEIKLLIFGTDKWQVYQQAKAEKTDHQPASHILHQSQTPVSVYWAP